MVGQMSSHSWGGMLQRRMDTAEVIDSAQQKDSGGNGELSTGQAMRAAHEWGQIRSESAVETFNEGGVNAAVELGGGAQAGQHGRGATQDKALEVKAAFCVLDHARQAQTRPDTIDQAFAAPTSCLVRESPLEGIPIRAKPIEGDVQRHLLSPAPHQTGQALNERPVTSWADNCPQPQPRGNHNRHRHPQHRLALHPYSHFVGLDLLQIQQSNMSLMHRSGMCSSPALPGIDGALIQPKGGHYRLARTAVSQQRHHLCHRLLRRSQAIKQRPSSVRKRPSTTTTFAALAHSAKPDHIAFTDLTLVRTFWIWTIHVLKVHFSLLLPSVQGEMSLLLYLSTL